MRVSCHSTPRFFTRDEAITAFGDAGVANSIATVNSWFSPKRSSASRPSGTRIPSHSSACRLLSSGKPGRLDYDPDDEIPWLPAPVREVWGPKRERLKEHHIFLRPADDERFSYIGTAHLGSWGGPRGDVPLVSRCTTKSRETCGSSWAGSRGGKSK